ncbi:hypothetical protein ACKUB1_08355 [Methanospirillum stamsii]|uniref:Uncharacterized protein n=1 Tax=Methanospirillum stamsii TaxID=1277351 RepID=A0A2V2NH45_9EURY|nr:hypothetical protein [Methanospirillum stamsii]PWR75708.1 hypothetical protein DLD82_03765 [Methanospirillum stamsii]
MTQNPCVHHEDNVGEHTCRLCGKNHCIECIHLGSRICYSCIYKGIIIIMVIMVIFSYVAWYGLL